MKPSWTKGSKERAIPVRTDAQRAVLLRAHRLAGRGSLIPSHRSYVQQKYVYEKQTARAGLSHLHGLRHEYAQSRYQELTGWKAPAAGGPKSAELTADQKILDRDARLTISRELGYEREQITLDRRAETSAGELYRSYVQWCEQGGERAETQTSFGRRLRERGLTQRKGHRATYWLGIGLLAADSVDSAGRFSGYAYRESDFSVNGKNGPHSPNPPHNGNGLDTIRAYLSTIESDHELIAEQLAECQRNPNTMRHWLARAEGAAP